MTWVGQRLPRLDDTRLLRGGGTFTDDIHLPGMLEATILRSPVAHGTLRGLDTAGLRVAGGDDAGGSAVHVFGPEHFLDLPGHVPVLWHLPGQFQHDRPVMDRRIRYVGEPVGVIVACDRYAAEDAAEAIQVLIDDLPAVTDPRAALVAGGPLLYPEAGTNVMAAWDAGDPDDHVSAVMAAADHVLRFPVRIGRLAGSPIECRGIVVAPDPGGKLTVWTSTQAPHAVRDMIASVTGLPQRRIRVVGPDVGGGFGVKDHIGEDELLVVLAALELDRPVKWIEDRWESLTVTRQARDEHHDVEIAFDADGTLRALRIRALRNGGAMFAIFGAGPLFSMSGMVPAPYRWDAVRVEATAVATNTCPTGAYRGFGQTQAIYVRERAIDLAARHLGMDPVEIRLRNLLSPDELPSVLRTAPLTLDNGDYPAALRSARRMAEAWDEPPDDGRVRGVGYSFYAQQAGVGPSAGNQAVGLDVGGYETAIIRMEIDGSVRAVVGTSCHGQGHETTFAQLVADHIGVDPADVEVIHSDTDLTPYSAYGTAASRSIAVGGGATVRASERLADRIRAVAAEMLEADPADIVLADGRATVAGTRIGVDIVRVAERAWQGWHLPRGMEPGLTERAAYDPEEFTYSYAAHVCRVAVDPTTGTTEVERYAVAHDCGTIVNPTVVEGQIHGGVAQGLGAALLEDATFDELGQPTAATFLDYLIPVSDSVPDIQVEHLVHPSPYTPGGMKGMGEGGTNGAFACVANGVAAALPDAADRLNVTPLTPGVIWEALHTGPPVL